MTELRERQSGAYRPAEEPGRGLRLLVTMPALNEERTVGDVIRAIPRDIPGVRSVDVLVINDGSTDATEAKAVEAGAEVINQPCRMGVGAAFHTALRYTLENPYDLVVSIDADGQFDPGHIPVLVEPVVSGRADFTTASRFKDPSLVPPMPWMKRWGNRMMSRLISRIAGQKFYDVSCGMRCYSSKAAMHLNLRGAFTYTQEVILNLAFKQMRIVEVPLAVRGSRQYGQSRVADNLFKYGMNTLRIIFRCYRDYRPMQFFGLLTLLLMVPGFLLEVFLLVHYIATGALSPHKWAGFVGAGLFIMGMLTFLIGMVGDMLDRQRIYLEELLYERRRQNRLSVSLRENSPSCRDGNGGDKPTWRPPQE